jgi:hypothetical protein
MRGSRCRLWFYIEVFLRPGAADRSRRTARLLIAAVCATAMLGAAPAAGGTVAVTQTLASGPARSLGEPAATQDSAVSIVVATTFGSAGARVRSWPRGRRAGAARVARQAPAIGPDPGEPDPPRGHFTCSASSAACRDWA